MSKIISILLVGLVIFGLFTVNISGCTELLQGIGIFIVYSTLAFTILALGAAVVYKLLHR